MSALSVEFFDIFRTTTEKDERIEPRVKFNPKTQKFSTIGEGIVLKKNATGTSSSVNLIRKLLNLRTKIENSEKLETQYFEPYATQLAEKIDFWPSETLLHDYSMLLDDYDVAAVEDIHMQSATEYGW